MNKLLLILLFMILGFGQVQAQGNFQNLDFESAQLVFIDPPTNRLIATMNALPGWSAFSGTNQLTDIQLGFGGGIPPVWLSSTQTTFLAIDGSFSVGLGGSTYFHDTGSISQTALVPADAQALLFKTTGSLNVSLGGQDLSYTVISNALNYTLYGAIIPSSFIGQTETLTFTAVTGGLLDDIQFSPEAVPEPSGISLLCLGSGFLFYIRKRKRFRL